MFRKNYKNIGLKSIVLPVNSNQEFHKTNLFEEENKMNTDYQAFSNSLSNFQKNHITGTKEKRMENALLHPVNYRQITKFMENTDQKIPYEHYSSNTNLKRLSEKVRLNFNAVNKSDIIDLILEPSATSIAGPYGKAIATPISHAILRRGQNTRVQFEPISVAVAGPGGIAHAEAHLNLDYIDE